MKMLALAFALLTSFSAEARSIQATLDATLYKVVINGQSTRYTGVAQVNNMTSKIHVAIYEDPRGNMLPPQPGVFRCMAAARQIRSFEVPLMSREQSCGSVYYKGVLDRTPVDGPRTEIQFVDNTQRVCEDVILGRYVIQINELNPWVNKTPHYLMY